MPAGSKNAPQSCLGRFRDMERVKCRTGGRSPAGRAPRRGGTQPGPGEERHFTRAMSQYAPGCWWGGFKPHRLPRGERSVLSEKTESPTC